MRSRVLLGVLLSSWVLLTVADSARAQVSSGTGIEAWIRVVLPSPDANVWFDHAPTRQKGTDRLFVSPLLHEGKTYTYTIKASWVENGREVTDERQVRVRPGRETVVNFRERPHQGTREPARSGPGADQDRPLTPPIAPEPGRPEPSGGRPLPIPSHRA